MSSVASATEKTGREWREWRTLSLSDIRDRSARLFGAVAVSSPCNTPTVAEKEGGGEHEELPSAEGEQGEKTSEVRQSDQSLDSSQSLMRARLGALFAPSRTLSTGSVSLDRAFLLAGQHPTSPRRRAPHATSFGGGLQAGRLYEVYGPPLCGKTTLIQNMLAARARHMAAAHSGTVDATPRDPSTSSSPLPLHPGSWDIVVCLTTTPSTSEHDGRLVDWSSSFLRHLQLPKRRRASASDAPADTRAERARLEVCAAHIHLMPITEPNMLLEALDQVHQSLIGCASTSSSTFTILHDVLIVIDSLEVIWPHVSLHANAVAHANHWYAAELHRRLRCCLACDLAATTNMAAVDHGTSAASTPLCQVTAVVVNGCAYYDLQRVSDRDGVKSSSSSALSVPRPQGGAHWQQAVDCRLLLEPMNVHMLGLAASQGTRHAQSHVASTPTVPSSPSSSLMSSPGCESTGRKRIRQSHARAHAADATEDDDENDEETINGGVESEGSSSSTVLPFPVRCHVVSGTREELQIDCILWQM